MAVARARKRARSGSGTTLVPTISRSTGFTIRRSSLTPLTYVRKEVQLRSESLKLSRLALAGAAGGIAPSAASLVDALSGSPTGNRGWVGEEGGHGSPATSRPVVSTSRTVTGVPLTHLSAGAGEALQGDLASTWAASRGRKPSLSRSRDSEAPTTAEIGSPTPERAGGRT
jgi:hypothetical protein